MSLDTSRAAIKVVLDRLVDAGQVYDYFRMAAHEAEIQSLFKSSGRLNVWFVSLSTQDAYTEQRRPANHALATERFELHQYYAVSDADASEKAQQVLIEAALAAFRSDKKLGDTVIESGPLQWAESGYRTFCGVLCHYARLTFSVLEQVEP